MPVNSKDHIVSLSDVLHGKPRLQAIRIPVSLILGYLSAKYSFEQIIQEIPDLKEEHIAACLEQQNDKRSNN